MQCTSFYRDPYETVAWQLYLRECALRAAREEVAFLEATGGISADEQRRIQERVLGDIKREEDATVDLNSVLRDVAKANRMRSILEAAGIVTLVKPDNTIHVLKADVPRVREMISFITPNGESYHESAR